MLGAGLNARGVIGVIAGVKLGVLNTVAYTIVVLVAIVTLMARRCVRYAMNLRRMLRIEARTGPGSTLPPTVAGPRPDSHALSTIKSSNLPQRHSPQGCGSVPLHPNGRNSITEKTPIEPEAGV
jgi:hypothetical protein